MKLNEVAGLLGYSKEQLTEVIEKGLSLPHTGTLVMLQTTNTGRSLDISDDQFDEFIAEFEKVEPGRWPPAAVRRELLVEAKHACLICSERVPLQFHHMLEWSKIQHHDVKHMIAICGTCHSRCSNGQIDYKSQVLYKNQASNRTLVIFSDDQHCEIKREADLNTLKDLYSVFPRPLVDTVLEEASWDRIHIDHIDVLDSAQKIFNSTLFHLYNTELTQLFKDFFSYWEMAWHIGRYTHHDFQMRGIATLSLSENDPAENWEQHKSYLEQVTQAQLAHIALNTHVRESYPEFDLDESDRQSLHSYWEFVKQIEKKVEDICSTSKNEIIGPEDE